MRPPIPTSRRANCSRAPLQGYYGVLGAGPSGSFFLTDGLIMNPALVVIGGSSQPGAITIQPGRPFPGGSGGVSTVINTGQRNVAAVAPLNDTAFLRLTTPVRQNITTATRDDSRTTLEMVNLITGEDTLLARRARKSGHQRFRHDAIECDRRASWWSTPPARPPMRSRSPA